MTAKKSKKITTPVSLYQRYCDLSTAFAAAGEPPVSDYWLTGAKAFYEGTFLEWLECAGRGSDKTRNIVRCAIVETLFGVHAIPASERHYFAIVSENKGEAGKTLKLIRSYLGILKVPFTSTADTIELVETNRGIKVLACRVGAVSGFRCFGWAADEVAKWSSEDGANPAEEVITSIRAMSVTHPTARGHEASSPLGTFGHFHETFAAGTNDRVFVRGPTPTWEANPSVTEEHTRRLAPNPRVWAREYAAIAQGAVNAVFRIEDIDAAMQRTKHETFGRLAPILVFDASRGGDDWVWAVACWCTDGTKKLLEVTAIGEVPFPDDTERSVNYLASIAHALEIKTVVSDQYEFPALQVLFRQRGLTLRECTWTQPSKMRGVDRFERWLRDKTIILPNNSKLRTQLAQYSEKVTASGSLTYEGSGRCDDYAQVLVTLAMADLERHLTGSPAHIKRPLVVYWGDDDPPKIPHSLVTPDMRVVTIAPAPEDNKTGAYGDQHGGRRY